MPEQDPLQSLYTELRRGSLTLAVLACLKKPHYGYALLQTLQDKGVDIEANTLYPLLRRLEGQGLLSSDWDTAEARPRKYYRLSAEGQHTLAALAAEWTAMQQNLNKLLEEDNG